MQPVHSCACPDCSTNLAVIQLGLIISLPVKGGGYRDVCIYDILLAEAFDEYTIFYIVEIRPAGKVITMVVSKNLGAIEKLKVLKGFVRLHRSYIINVLHVGYHCENHVKVNGLDKQIPIGDTYRDNFTEFTCNWKINTPAPIIIP